jgi:hypothetical protein
MMAWHAIHPVNSVFIIHLTEHVSSLSSSGSVRDIYEMDSGET